MDPNKNNANQPSQTSAPNSQTNSANIYQNPAPIQSPANNSTEPAQKQSSSGLVRNLIIGLGIVLVLAVVVVLADSKIRAKLFPSKNTSSVSSVSNISNVCTVINSATFNAVKKDSLTNINTLKFKNGSAEWDYANIVTSGPYNCSNNQIQLQLQNSHNNGGDYTAYFMPSTQILRFHSLDYSFSH